MKIPYWLTCLFLSIATVYCMFHYAVDVIGGLLLGVLAVLTFNRSDIKRYSRGKPFEEREGHSRFLLSIANRLREKNTKQKPGKSCCIPCEGI